MRNSSDEPRADGGQVNPSTDGTEQNEVQLLFDLYYDIGAKLCERLGHHWVEVNTRDGTARPMNASKVERCRYCNDTRLSPEQISSSGTQGDGSYTTEVDR